MKKVGCYFPESFQWAFLRKGMNALKITLLIFLTSTLSLVAAGGTPESGQQGAQRKISGIVNDSKGLPITGATVTVKGTSVGALTDGKGRYEVTVPDKAEVLVISFIGMKPQEVLIGVSNIIDVTLTEETFGLDEVVVIGYGTQKKADITGAVSTVQPEKLQGINQSVSHAIQGTMSGVTVIQNSGQPGSGVEIRIRGAGSINDNSPLYVVDGIIGSISNLNPADIESMSVLKDAASAAIYGSRGANGVVIVTTKKGRRGEKATVTYNTSQGVQQAWRMPSSLSAADRNLIHKEALTNDGTPTSESIWDYYNDPTNAVTRTDWFDEIFRSGYIATHDLSISGGTQTSNYAFSLGVLNDNGIVKNSSYKRYNVRFNSQHEIVKNLTFGENISLVFTDQNIIEASGSYDGVLSAALFNMRNTPVWEDQAKGIYGLPTGDFPNPVASLNSRDNVSKNTTAGGNAYLEYKLLDLFTIKTDFGYNWGFGKNKNFKAIAINGGRGLNQNTLSESYGLSNTWIWNNTISFDKKLANHHIAALAGMSMEKGLYEWTNTGTAKDFSNQDKALRYFNNAGTFPEHPSGSADDYSLLSYFGRLSYEFADKYLFAANIRADGSSKFPEDSRWGIFPSVSGGWRISKEDFFANMRDVISDFKIRGSWGQLGNDKIRNYEYYSTITTVGSPTLDGSAFTAYAQNRFANTKIKWEVTTQTNIGIDLGFMKDKLYFTADYFDKETSDILVQVPLVSSLGVGVAPYQNSGQVSNKGFDLGLTYRNRDKEFKYEISANLSHVVNELVTLGVAGAKEIFTADYKNTMVGRIAQGEPIGHFYVLNMLGIFQTQSEIDSYKSSTGSKIQPAAVPGDIKFEDRNGDGQISADDRFNAGNSFPTLTYSLNATVDYKGWDANMLLIGSQGNSIFNGLTLGGTIMQGTSYNNGPAILDRWTVGKPSTTVPRVTVKDLNNNRYYSTLYIEDGSFARVKYITLGYTFKKGFLATGFSHLRLYATLQNPLTLTKYSGYDPEVGSEGGFSNNMYGVDKGAYPQARSYIFGLNVTF
jgi:TonB-dependent starch-binding outer membrane protein SusC